MGMDVYKTSPFPPLSPPPLREAVTGAEEEDVEREE